MKKVLQRTLNTMTAFSQGFSDAIHSTPALMISAAVGFQQGMKYTGNLKRGLTAAAISLGCTGVLGGVLSIATNADYIAKHNVAE